MTVPFLRDQMAANVGIPALYSFIFAVQSRGYPSSVTPKLLFDAEIGETLIVLCPLWLYILISKPSGKRMEFKEKNLP